MKIEKRKEKGGKVNWKEIAATRQLGEKDDEVIKERPRKQQEGSRQLSLAITC